MKSKATNNTKRPITVKNPFHADLIIILLLIYVGFISITVEKYFPDTYCNSTFSFSFFKKGNDEGAINRLKQVAFPTFKILQKVI